jgi:hypothetical protein
MKTVIAKFVGTAIELKKRVDEVLGETKTLKVQSDEETTEYEAFIEADHTDHEH